MRFYMSRAPAYDPIHQDNVYIYIYIYPKVCIYNMQLKLGWRVIVPAGSANVTAGAFARQSISRKSLKRLIALGQLHACEETLALAIQLLLFSCALLWTSLARPPWPGPYRRLIHSISTGQ